MGGATEYLRRNWGAPFVSIFIILLLVVAGELSYGSEALANDLAVYAFYFLAAGVLLQIASYVKFRNEPETLTKTETEPHSSPRPPRFSHRTKVILAVAIIALLGGAAAAVALEYGSTHGFNSLSVSVDYVNALSEPGGAVVVAFAVSASGGVAPYSYSAQWPDGQVQTSVTGAFSRTFVNQAVPATVAITVTSSDGQKVTRSAAIPAPSPSSGVSSSSTSSATSSGATSTSSATLSTSSGAGKFPPLTVTGNFTSEYVEPGGDTVVTFGVSVRGGELPFNFVAVWSDGAVQSNTLGTFSRTFTSGEAIPTSAQVTVISGDDQKLVVAIALSPNGS